MPHYNRNVLLKYLKQNTYDKYEPFQQLKKQDFWFIPTSYEVWTEGALYHKHSIQGKIEGKVIGDPTEEKVQLSVSTDIQEAIMMKTVVFDNFISSHDKLQLVTLPQTTKDECIGLKMLKINVATTVVEKDFQHNEPYCCNIYTKDNAIRKVVFCFNAPEKMIIFNAEQTDDLQNIAALNFTFQSSDHIRLEHGVQVAGPNGGALRWIKVEALSDGSDHVEVTIFNLEDGKSTLQMTPKLMKVISKEAHKIELAGIGADLYGNSMENIGLSINIQDGIINNCILHLKDSHMDIQYFI